MVTRVAMVVLVLAGCRGDTPAKKQHAPPRAKPAAAPATPASGDSVDPCHRFVRAGFERSGEPLPADVDLERDYAGDLAYCRSLSPDAVRCTLDEPSLLMTSVCLQLEAKDRDLGRAHLAEIRERWPGRVGPLEGARGARGCSFGGAAPGEVSREAMNVAFTDAGEIVIAGVEKADGRWQCSTTDPPNRCAWIDDACVPVVDPAPDDFAAPPEPSN